MRLVGRPVQLHALPHLVGPRGKGGYAELISFVKDRPGHDRRYAMDITKIRRELGWAPRESFESGLEKTVRWYLANIETHFARSEAA